MSKILAYHFLKSDMCSHAGHEPPWKEGETRTLDGEIVICVHGYHASRTAWDALQFAPGPVLCLVEVEPVKEHTDKLVSRSRRLIKAVNVERELREFVADCAERVLHFYEEAYPGDQRPRAAIATARAYARGEATDGELNAAADAAYAAARAARNAANAADAAADAAYAAADAADAAAYAAARAAYAAARAAYAARAAAYAAADAADAAAYAAARAADAAARAADAAYAAADAADAERRWQREQFDVRLAHLFATEIAAWSLTQEGE